MATTGTKPMNSTRTNENLNGHIVIEEERLKESFTQIPNTILRRPELSAGAKLTYMVLLSYAWQQDSCFPGQSTLATDLGAGQRSVIRYLRELQQAGLLRVKRRGLGKTNLYTLARWERTGSAKMALQEMPTLSRPKVPNWHPKNTHENQIQKNKDSMSNQFDVKQMEVANISPKEEIREPATDDRPDGLRSGLHSLREALGRYYRARHLQHDQEQQPTAMEAAPHESGLLGDRRPGSFQIEDLIADFSAEFGDDHHRASNATQALRLWSQSGIPELSFVARLYEARSRTRQVLMEARVRSDGEPRIRKRMPYFFSCLRDLLANYD
jgi:hypothetical protein